MMADVQEAVVEDYHARNSWSFPRNMYPYIALGHERFRENIKAHLKPRMRVIDVGCGAGDKLLAFHKLEPKLQIFGLEYHPTMAAFAQYVAPFATVIEGNALLYDYSSFDLIYMYRPIPLPALQAKLQRRVMNSMRVGAILTVEYQELMDDAHNAMFPDLDSWVKPTTYKVNNGRKRHDSSRSA